MSANREILTAVLAALMVFGAAACSSPSTNEDPKASGTVQTGQAPLPSGEVPALPSQEGKAPLGSEPPTGSGK